MDSSHLLGSSLSDEASSDLIDAMKEWRMSETSLEAELRVELEHDFEATIRRQLMVESAQAGIVAWKSLHQSFDCCHGLRNTIATTATDDIIRDLFSNPYKRLPFHWSIPMHTVELINAAFDVDPAKRPALKELIAAAASAPPPPSSSSSRDSNRGPNEMGSPRLDTIFSFEIDIGQRIRCCAIAPSSLSWHSHHHDHSSSVTVAVGGAGFLALYDVSAMSPPTLLAKLFPSDSSASGAASSDDFCFVCFSHDGKWLVSSSDSEKTSVVVWGVESRKQVARLQQRQRPGNVAIAAFSPSDSSILAIGTGAAIVVWRNTSSASWSQERIIQLQRAENDETEKEEEVVVTLVRQLSFSRDGTKLLAACGDSGAVVFDVANGSLLLHIRTQSLSSSSSSCTAACFSPDEQSVLVADGTVIRVFSVILAAQAGGEIREINNNNNVNSLFFTASDPRYFVSASTEWLRLWCFESMRIVHEQRINGNDATAVSIALSPPTGCRNSDTVFTFGRCGQQPGSVGVLIECHLVNKFLLDAAYAESVIQALTIWSTIHPGVDEHNLGKTRDEIIHNTFYRDLRLPCHKSLPADVVTTLSAAFDRDARRRPTRETMTALSWRVLRLASDVARRAHFEASLAGVDGEATVVATARLNNNNNNNNNNNSTSMRWLAAMPPRESDYDAADIDDQGGPRGDSSCASASTDAAIVPAGRVPATAAVAITGVGERNNGGGRGGEVAANPFELQQLLLSVARPGGAPSTDVVSMVSEDDSEGDEEGGGVAIATEMPRRQEPSPQETAETRALIRLAQMVQQQELVDRLSVTELRPPVGSSTSASSSRSHNDDNDNDSDDGDDSSSGSSVFFDGGD